MEKNINIGFSLLRFICAFEVVTMHYCDLSQYSGYIWKIYRQLVQFAVPIFFEMSFFFFSRTLETLDRLNWLKRMQRLLVPQIGWTFIYFSILQLIDLVFHKNRVTWRDFFYQLFTGSSPVINGAMWFQIVLILLTLFYMLIWLCFYKYRYIILCILTFCMVAICISGTASIINSFAPFEISCPFERFFEMAIYGLLGILLRSYVWENTKRRIMLSVVLFLSAIIILINTRYLASFVSGYLSPLNIVISSLCLILFGQIDTFFKNDMFRHTIFNCSKYTLGIYCMHNLIGTILNQGLEYIGLSQYKFKFCGCIVIYLICYTVCFIFSKIIINRRCLTMLID